MKNTLPLFLLLLSIFSCTPQNNDPIAIGSKKIDKAWLDSIVKSSDSSYIKPYYRSDFVTAVYYTNKKDSTVCQVMKDSAGIIRQIVVAEKGTRTFFGSYYKNSQLQADLPLDEFGQYHGTATYYYENGSVQTTGKFLHGFKTGPWKNFDTKGKLLSTDSYDKNGQVIP